MKKESDTNKSSEALAAIVVAHRSLGIFKDESRYAMAELMKRKNQGDDFDFESYIQSKLKNVPKSHLDPKSIRLMSNIVRMGISK